MRGQKVSSRKEVASIRETVLFPTGNISLLFVQFFDLTRRLKISRKSGAGLLYIIMCGPVEAHAAQAEGFMGANSNKIEHGREGDGQVFVYRSIFGAFVKSKTKSTTCRLRLFGIFAASKPST